MDDQNQNPQVQSDQTTQEITESIPIPMQPPNPNASNHITPQLDEQKPGTVQSSQPSDDYTVEAWYSKGPLVVASSLVHGKMVISNSSVRFVDDNGTEVVNIANNTI